MIIVSVKYKALPGKRVEILEFAKEAVRLTRQEKGNQEYTVYPSLEDENAIFVYEEWESLDDLKAHIQAPHMTQFASQRKPLVLEGSYQLNLYEGHAISL